MAKTNTMVWVLLIIAGLLLWRGGIFDGLLSGKEPTSSTSPAYTGPDHYTEDTTVTLSSWDLYAMGTEPGVGHLVLKRDGERNVDYAEDGTFTATPGDQYMILLGNVTTGGSYAPFLASGIVPDKGTFTIAHGLPAYDTSIAFTYWNENAQVNTAQAMDADSSYTIPIRFQASDNQIYGNPQCKKDNLLCIEGNSTVFSDFELSGETTDGAPTVFNPLKTNNIVKCYHWDKIADNGKYEGNVVVKTASTAPSATNDINITIFDAAIDYDADTLELIAGTTGSIVKGQYNTLTPICSYEDEDNNDIGDTTSQVYGISVS